MAVAGAVPEAERNRLLRRADWRFLLADPRPRKAVCFADGMLADAVRLIAQEVIDPPGGGARGECDLAVGLDPDAAALSSAWAALRCGGWCYTEWHSFRGRSPSAIRRRLHAAGFRDVACYWPRPRPCAGGAAVWVPLDGSGALDFVLTSRPGPRCGRRGVWALLRKARWRLGPRLRAATPIVAVARKRATSGTADPPPAALSRGSRSIDATLELDALIRRDWESWRLGPPPDRVSWLLLAPGTRSDSKVVALLFETSGGAPSTAHPRIAIKMSRTAGSARALEREWEILDGLARAAPAVRGIPRPLFCRSHGAGVALGATAVPGIPLNAIVTRRHHRAMALRAARWLAALPRSVEPEPRETWWPRLVAPVLADFEARFGAVVDRGVIRESMALVGSLAPLPLVCEQRDFAPWNVLVDDAGELAVTDWESAEPAGVPGPDLIYFLTFLAFSLERAQRSGRFRDAYRAAWSPGTPLGRVAAECVAVYADLLGVGAGALRPLRALTWLLHSRSEYAQLAADAGGRPGPEALRRSLFLGLWEEEVRSSAGA